MLQTVRVLDLSRVVKDRKLLVVVKLPGVGSVPVINTPFNFSAAATGPAGPPPVPGQDNREVLKALAGFTEAEIMEMEQSGLFNSDK